MISRTWHGIVPLNKKDAFEKYEYETGVKDTLAIAGNKGAYLKVVEQGAYAHFFLCTKWDSFESMTAYAGNNPSIAVTYPEYDSYGLISDPIVIIQEVSDDNNPFLKKKLKPEEIVIRPETESDWYAVELMTQHAFWNKHVPGCNEHYLVHLLRHHPDYLPELSRVAVKDGNIIGCIMYSKSCIFDGLISHNILTFGPLCVEPDWQGCGVGELLLKETMKLAVKQGYPGIVIFGEPDYYPRFGFRTCDNFQITTPDGKNFDAFMGYELVKDGFKNIKGKFYESPVFENISKEETEEFNKKFPPLEKKSYPWHWHD